MAEAFKLVRLVKLRTSLVGPLKPSVRAPWQDGECCELPFVLQKKTKDFKQQR